MREVILTESGIVLLEAAYALLLLCRFLVSMRRFRCHGLYVLTMPLPLFKGAFPICFCHRLILPCGKTTRHSMLQFSGRCHLIHQEAVLVLVDGLDEFRRDLRVEFGIVL